MFTPAVALPELLTPAEVAAWFHVSLGWVFDHSQGRRRPHLPCRPLGKLIRFDRTELEAWLADQSRNRVA
jgi:predicted DNA-binding transcriptional regulator AlpA